MTLSTFTSRFTIAMVTAGLGLSVLMFSLFSPHAPAWIENFDSSCVRSIFSSETRVTRYDPESKQITVRSLGHHPDKGRKFQPVSITDDPDRIFETSPPSPLDYAVILQKLYDRGFRNVVISTRMSWDTPANDDDSPPAQGSLNDATLTTRALDSKLALFDSSVIGLPVTRGASGHPLPQALKRSLIPHSRVTGNTSLIPTVNQVPLPTSINGGDNTLAGFHRIESAPENKGHLQLLAHWKGSESGLIPSIQLLTIMCAHDIAPDDVTVHAAKHIRLGSTGPVIPIDEYGQTPAASASETTTPTSITAESLITKNTDQEEAPADSNQLAFIEANGDRTSASNLLAPDAANRLGNLAKSLPVPGDPEYFRRLPFLLEALIIITITLVLSPFVSLSSYNRHLTFALAAPMVLVLLLALMEWNQQWFGLTAPVIAILAAWLTTSQISPSAKQK